MDKPKQEVGSDNVPEINVTPEMVEAGARVIWTYFSDAVLPQSDSAREAAIEVFRVMSKSQR